MMLEHAGFEISSLYVCLLGAVGYLLVLAYDRLYRSPLSGIPGPRLAALTFWYETYYDVFLPGQYVFRIKEMHEQYGPIVRITPRELSFSDPDYVDTIYAPGPGNKRDKDPEAAKALGVSRGLGATIDHDHHRRRRAPLSAMFSRQSILRDGAGLLGEKSAQLDDIFSRAARAGEVVNLSDVYYAMTNDVVCQYSFGSNDNLVGDPATAGVMRRNLSALLRGTNFGKSFLWVQNLLSKLPLAFAPPGVQDMVKFRQKIRAQIDAIATEDKSAGEKSLRSILQILKADTKLAPAERDRDRLEDEAALTVMAGTESPASALSLAHYHLLANPKVMARLREELSERPSDTLEELDQLPYLNAVQQEAYRLNFGLSGRHAMIDPVNTNIYTHNGKSYTIPAGTPMGVQTLVLHTNEAIFPDPWTFNPDRWLGEEGAARRKHLLAFQKGARQCLGINLAKAELSMGLAMAAKWDMELYETDGRDVTFMYDYFVSTPRLDSKGIRAKVKGRHF